MTTRELSPDKQAARVYDYDFLSAVKVGKQSAHNGPLPVLGCVLVQKRGDRIEIISTDLETVIRGLTQTFGGDYPDWAVCVPQKPLFDWLRAIEPHKPTKKHPAQVLELERCAVPTSINGHTYAGLAGEWLKIKAGNTTARFNGIDAQEFPLLDGRIPAEGPLENFKLA